jgi:hypothetical protein
MDRDCQDQEKRWNIPAAMIFIFILSIPVNLFLYLNMTHYRLFRWLDMLRVLLSPASFRNFHHKGACKTVVLQSRAAINRSQEMLIC